MKSMNDKRPYLVLSAAFLTVFITFAVRYGYGALLPEMYLPLNMTRAQAGLIYSSYFLSYMVFSPLLGRLTDVLDVGARSSIDDGDGIRDHTCRLFKVPLRGLPVLRARWRRGLGRMGTDHNGSLKVVYG